MPPREPLTRERIVERYGEPRLWQDWQAFLDA